MSKNSNNLQSLNAYLEELRAQMNCDSQKQKLRTKYQHKILELLIERETSKDSYDNIMVENMALKSQLQQIQSKLEWA